MTLIDNSKERADFQHVVGLHARALGTMEETGVVMMAKVSETIDMLSRIEELHTAFGRTTINKPAGDADQAFWLAVGVVLRGDL